MYFSFGESIHCLHLRLNLRLRLRLYLHLLLHLRLRLYLRLYLHLRLPLRLRLAKTCSNLNWVIKRVIVLASFFASFCCFLFNFFFLQNISKFKFKISRRIPAASH